jgi:hypothetical protein
MKSIETTATVTPDRTLTIRLPVDVTPGEHRIVVVIDESLIDGRRPPLDLPVHDLGPWPEGLSLRREDLYGDDGR